MKRSLLLLLITLVVFANGSTVIETETVKPLKPTGTLGTCSYKPTAVEQSYFAKLDQSETKTGSFMAPYSIHRKQGVYVSWFGIVRGIKQDQGSGKALLFLEQKYFDGLTDCHIMLVSISGDGDFVAHVDSDQAKDLPLLSLVRVYGRVSSGQNEAPHLTADYIRVWPWLTFTFTDLGPPDRGNPRWRRLCKLCSGRVYKPYPNEDYYRNVLGDPTDPTSVVESAP